LFLSSINPQFLESRWISSYVSINMYIDQTLFILILTVFLHTSFYKQIFFRLSDIFKVIFKFFFFLHCQTSLISPIQEQSQLFYMKTIVFSQKYFKLSYLKIGKSQTFTCSADSFSLTSNFKFSFGIFEELIYLKICWENLTL
jgi:hypothetical protein